MKSQRIIAVLLLLNFGLFVGILAYFLRLQLGGPVSGRVEPAADTAGSPPTLAAEKVVIVTNQLQWAQLESEDYKTYIARLRSIGCPEETLRDIIIADLDKLMAPELQALYGRRSELKYWHPEEAELLNDVDPRELARKERELDQRKREIIRELVSADLHRERMKTSGQEDYLERRLSFLPETRRDQLRQLVEKYEDAEQTIREKELDDSEPLDLADRAQLRLLKQQRQAEIDSLLTPTEKEQFELWMSTTANSVRSALYGMNASEQEFQTIYQARKEFDERWSKFDPDLLDATTRAAMEQDRAQAEAGIRTRLGEERYAELKRGEDEDFHRLSAVATRFKLPKEKAAEVYSYKKVALDYRAQVHHDPNLTLQQKEEAMKAIAEETENAVRGVLGEKAYRYYLRTGQGGWMRE